MTIEVGQLLDGKYRIIRLIGAGGMGRVYEGQHEALGTGVAIKCLLPHLARVPTLSDRFLREARISARLTSPYVTRVTDVSQLPDGTPYLVMELLRGELLQERLERQGLIPQTVAVSIARQILKGLEEAHALGIVHRDLKPENVFLVSSQDARQALQVKLLDFGIAKVKTSEEFQTLTKPGTAMGTPEYMAPEQAYSADQADERSDLYSVGVMLYEMLCGSLPAEGETPLEIANKIIAGALVPLGERAPAVPAALAALVMDAMAPDPNQRPLSAAAFNQALEPFSTVGAATPERGSTRPGHASPSSLGPGPMAGSERAPSPRAPAGAPAPATARGVGEAASVTPRGLGVQSDAPGQRGEERGLAPAGSDPRAAAAPEVAAPPNPGSRAAMPPTEQMSAVALDSIQRAGKGPVVGGVAPTAPDPPMSGAPQSQPARAPGRRRAAWVVGLLLLVAVGLGLAWVIQCVLGPGPAPAPPRLPPAVIKR